MAFEQQATVVERLTLHQLQRCQSVPTLSVLMGKAIAIRQLWTQWHHQAQRPMTVCIYKSNRALFEAWLSTVTQHDDVRSLVIQKLAELANQPTEQLDAWLANTSNYQIQMFWQRVTPLSATVPMLRSLLESPFLGQTSASQTGIWPDQSSNQDSNQNSNQSMLQHFLTVAQLLSPQSIPGLLVLLPESDKTVSAMGDMSVIEAALTALTHLVEAVPMIPVGLLLAADQGKRLLEQLPESRAKALLRRGLIEVANPEPARLKQWLGERGIEDEKHQQPILRLAEQHGATSASLATVVALTTSTPTVTSDKDHSPFRSLEEWLLFQYLEARAATTGRFQVNTRLEINFGNRPMEVDFLDAAAKIVIELDGYYHFSSLDNYRRDRRKDIALQQQGFWVLRFLAEDVISDFETILDTIEQAIAWRQSQPFHRSEA